jgi:hypothetical protein
VRRAAVLLAALACAAPAARAADPTVVFLEAPPSVTGLLVEDADGDGLRDLVVLADHEVRIWRAAKGPVAPAPAHRATLPADATFLDLAPPSNGRPTFFALAGSKVVRVGAGAGAEVGDGPALDSPWGPGRTVFADFARGAQAILPSRGGWTWFDAGFGARPFDVAQPPRRFTTAAGSFLDEGAVVEERWGAPQFAASGGAVWIFGPAGLQAFAPGEGGRVAARTLPTDFLTNEAGRAIRNRLVDLDVDGLPDLCHEATSNLDGVYAFFRTPPAGEGDRFAAARAVLRLSGFQLASEHPDLDGDGRPDFVVTSIEIDAGNTMRALGGRVTARTKAFLNRSGKGGDLFPQVPDAERESDVGVAIRFSYTGAIDVERSYTILAGADLDGDRRKDLVIRTGPDALSVWPGTATGAWAAEPRKVAIPSMAGHPALEAHAADLTGDGKDDLVLVYAAPPGGAPRIAVLVSR